MKSINLHQEALEAGEGAGLVVREVFVAGPEPASPGTRPLNPHQQNLHRTLLGGASTEAGVV